jgi:Bacterial Ig domain
VQLVAEPGDDFGIRRVTFFDGASEVGSDTSPPYTAAFTLPDAAACGAREVAATAEDSLGQTTTATSTLTVVCDTPGGQPKPPTVELPDNLTTIRRSGTTVTVRPEAERAITSVDFFLGARRVCRDTEAPYQCRVVPHSSEIGSQTLRVVVTDALGLTGQDSRQVTVPKFGPRGLLLSSSEKKLSGNRVRRTVTATVLPPAGVKRATACAGGRIATVVKRGRTTIIDRETELDRSCRAVVMRITTRRGASRALRYEANVRFGGTTVLATAQKTRRFR